MKVKISEVYNKKQKDWACWQKDLSIEKRKKGLSKEQAEEMCKSEIKNEEIDESFSSSGNNGTATPASVVSTAAKQFDGFKERAKGQMMKNVKETKYIEEILDEIEYDIGKIVPKGYLNRKFWDKNRLLDRQSKTKLTKIAEDFIEKIDLQGKVKDITITGSMASYNWHKKSDIDLHIVINYEDFNEDIDLLKDYMALVRSSWNKQHEIMIRGHEVELYIQDEDEVHHANGVYSIQRDEWIVKPSPATYDIDTDGAIKKADGIQRDIEIVEDLMNSKRFLEASGLIEKLKKKIKNLRSSGLNKEGIYSIENLAFKLLRNAGEIDRLHGYGTKAYDEMMSISDMSRDIDINLLDEEQINEKMMLKSGPNGWDLYSKLVAEAYLAAPKFESRAVPHFEAMIPFVEKMFKRIQSKVKVEFVDYHAYSTADELRSDVFNNGVMKIATIDAEHDVFDPETNAKFRAVHDFMSHIQAIGSRGTDFSLKGEIQSYNTHLKTMPPEAWPALFTEIIGQASTFFYQGGEFAEQKIVLLDGFDYENLGVVDGYDIVDKELIKTEENIDIDIENEKMVAESSKNQGIEKHIDAKVQDSGQYQTKTMANYTKDRKDYLFLGDNRDTGGGTGHKSASKQASKSATPIGEGGCGIKQPKITVKIR